MKNGLLLSYGAGVVALGRRFAVYMSFFDDSGKESNPKAGHVCMAGYLASDVIWNEFLSVWQHHLIKHKISGLHMRELIPIQGEYKTLGWDTAKRDEVLSEFIQIIKDTSLIGFGVGVDADAWCRSVPKDLIAEHGNAMEFCMMRVVRLVMDRFEIAAPRDLITMIFDSDQEFAPRRFKVFSWVKEHSELARQYLVSIGFGSPINFLGLQPADFLAWLTRKELIQKSGGFKSTAHFEELFSFSPGYVPEYVGEWWTAEEIENRIVRPWKEQHAANAKNKTA